MNKLLLFTLISFSSCVYAQTSFQNTYMVSGNDEMKGMIGTADNGYLYWGESSGDNVIMKLDSAGNTQWLKEYVYEIYDVIQTSDGNYVLATDRFIVKLDTNGEILWLKYSPGFFEFRSLIQTLDGGLALTGWKSDDMFLMKTDNMGDTTWVSYLGNSGSDIGWDLMQYSADSSYYVTLTHDNGAFNDDLIISHFDKNGLNIWNKELTFSLMVPHWNYANQILETVSGNILVTGKWSGLTMVEIDASGTPVRSGHIPALMTHIGGSVVSRVSGGGYFVIGHRDYSGASRDFELVRLDSALNVMWSKAIGGAKWDTPSALVLTADGGIAIGGVTQNFHTEYEEYFVVKSDSLASLPCHASPLTHSLTPLTALTSNYPIMNVTHPAIYGTSGFPSPVSRTSSFHDICTCVAPTAGFFYSGGGNFADNSSWGDMWIIDFGDGSIDTSYTYGITYHNFPSNGAYYVCQTVINSCGTDTFCDTVHYVFTPVSVGNIQKKDDVSIFPNPSNGKFIIEGAGKGKLELTDINGKLICTSDIKENSEIDLSYLEKGLYFARIVMEDRIFVKKIILQ